jgi:hypothetical protein
MTVTGFVKDKFRNLRLINALAEEYYLMKQDDDNQSRSISSDRFEEYDTHILIDQKTYIRCIVGGMTDEDTDVNTVPPEMTSRALERIMALSHSGYKVDVSTGVMNVSRGETNKELKEAYISNSTYKAGVSFLGRSGVGGSDRWERNAVNFTITTL